jgi:hypothetical protein
MVLLQEMCLNKEFVPTIRFSDLCAPVIMLLLTESLFKGAVLPDVLSLKW